MRCVVPGAWQCLRLDAGVCRCLRLLARGCAGACGCLRGCAGACGCLRGCAVLRPCRRVPGGCAPRPPVGLRPRPQTPDGLKNAGLVLKRRPGWMKLARAGKADGRPRRGSGMAQAPAPSPPPPAAMPTGRAPPPTRSSCAGTNRAQRSGSDRGAITAVNSTAAATEGPGSGLVRQAYRERAGGQREYAGRGCLQGDAAERGTYLRGDEEEHGRPPQCGERDGVAQPQGGAQGAADRHRGGGVPGRVVQQERQPEGVARGRRPAAGRGRATRRAHRPPTAAPRRSPARARRPPPSPATAGSAGRGTPTPLSPAPIRLPRHRRARQPDPQPATPAPLSPALVRLLRCSLTPSSCATCARGHLRGRQFRPVRPSLRA